MHEQEAIENFLIWFVEPINKLKELPNGAGGFVAFMVGLSLYERLLKARLSLSDKKADVKEFQRAMQADLHLNEQQRSFFWDFFRNGLLHQAMPKLGKTNYCFHHTFSGIPEFTNINGQPSICIDPWKFTDRVLNEFLENPILIIRTNSYPFASIQPFEFT